MANDDNDRNSTFENLAKGLLGVENAADELEKELDRLIPNTSGGDLDLILGGTIMGVAERTVADAITEAADEEGRPLVHSRERELPAGEIGVHIFVSEPDARIFKSEKSVLITVGQWKDETFLGFPPGRIDREQGGDKTDTVAEFMVYPKGYQEPLPPAEEEDDETPDDLDVEMDPDDVEEPKSGVDVAEESDVLDKTDDETEE